MKLGLLATFVLARCGVASFQEELAELYAPPLGMTHDTGLKQDYGKAAYWRKKAAAQGSSTAQHNLGCMYYFGEGVQQDFDRAAQLFKQAERPICRIYQGPNYGRHILPAPSNR